MLHSKTLLFYIAFQFLSVAFQGYFLGFGNLWGITFRQTQYKAFKDIHLLALKIQVLFNLKN